jgi:hypothetical protein
VIITTLGENSSSNWETVPNRVPQGLVLGPLLFVIYINDLPHKIHYIAKPVIYADDTNISVNDTDMTELQTKINDSVHHIYEWFSVTGLTLNFDKTDIIKFSSKKSKEIHNHFSYHNSIIKESDNIKFLGLESSKFLSWKKPVDKLLPKLSSACSVIRTMSSYSNISTLKMIYFANFHSLLEYSIVFWGNSTGSEKVFRLQKRIIRLMTGSNARTSCRPLFPKLGIMTLSSQYIFSLMRFLSHNLELYTFNSAIHNYNTRNRIQLHKPSAALTVYQKGLYVESLKIFNKLPYDIAELILQKKNFMAKLKKYLTVKAFYSTDEYKNDQSDG